MTASTAGISRTARWTMHPGYLAGALAVLAMAISGWCLSRYVPVPHWSELFVGSRTADLRLLVARYSFLPRCVVGMLAGAALGLAGTVLQHVLRNPLAEPTTLGVSAGALLSLTLASLWWPGLLDVGREGVALAGAATALLLVTAISWHRGFSSIGIILSGLLVTLTAGAITSVLTLFFGERLTPVFIWQTGNLYQDGWGSAAHLSIGLGGGALLAALIAGPLAVLDLGDEGARSVGQRPAVIRVAAMLLSSALTAVVVAEVGVVGFIGLVAPWLARLAGARTLRQRLVWGPLTGASLLWLADGCVQWLGQAGTALPTGAVTALCGTPLLIWMLSKLKEGMPAQAQGTPVAPARRARAPGAWTFAGGVALLVCCVVLSASFNRELAGWSAGSWDHVRMLLPLRAPRIAAALAAGAMLSIAGVIMQRITGNPMASPEVLGISSGALLAMVALIVFLPAATQGTQAAAATAGALVVLSIMFSLSRRASYSPDRLILTGVAMTTVLGSVVSLMIASGDPRALVLQAWMSGSTYPVGPAAAVVASGAAVVALVAMPFVARPLEIMSLGDASASSVGVDLRRYRSIVLLLCAMTTGAATLIVGPVSFVGLLGPHLARMFGFRRVRAEALGASIMGALLMSLADWLGRNVLYPNQMPAGLMVMFIGGPYFLVLMWRQKS